LLETVYMRLLCVAFADCFLDTKELEAVPVTLAAGSNDMWKNV
jgi:hypothetical protein